MCPCGRWSGNRTRDTQNLNLLLYPTELSSGDVPDSNRRPTAFAAALPTELTSLRGTPSPDPRHTPRQRRAHRTGMQARTAVDRSSMFRIGASDMTSKAPIRVRSHPLAARAEASRHGASLRLRGGSLPRTSNVRMLRERDAIAFDSCDSFVRAPKRKRPRVLEPEGVRVASGDRGDRSPRCERISRWWWCRNNSAC